MGVRRLLAVLLPVLLLHGCSADGSVGYLEAVADINQRMETASFAALPRGVEPTWEAIAAVVDAREGAVAELRGLEPPEAFEIEHEAYTTSLRVLVEESQAFLDATRGLDTEDFLTALDGSQDLGVLAGAVARSCSALQAAATTAGHDIDIGC